MPHARQVALARRFADSDRQPLQEARERHRSGNWKYIGLKQEIVKTPSYKSAPATTPRHTAGAHSSCCASSLISKFARLTSVPCTANSTCVDQLRARTPHCEKTRTVRVGPRKAPRRDLVLGEQVERAVRVAAGRGQPEQAVHDRDSETCGRAPEQVFARVSRTAL
jgi:hypothetical protein